MTQPATGRGGPRTPRNPAPVSPPGRLSRRTDGGPAQRMQNLTDAAHGEQATFRDAQAGAPMSATQGGQGAGTPVNAVDLANVTPLNAASARPDEPITAGAASGDGVGPEALGMSGEDRDLQTMGRYKPALELMAAMPGATPAFRDYVRRVRAITP